MPKGFLDTALRVTAIAFLIIVTLSVASFGLSRAKPSSEQVASSEADGDKAGADSVEISQTPDNTRIPLNSTAPTRQIGPDPLAEHLDRLGQRLDEIASSVVEDRSTRTEIAKLADSVQAVRQQSGVSGDRLQEELRNLRVNNEVELRDLNRKIGDVSQRSQQLERELIEQRTGILTALESQRATIANQVARLEGGLGDVHSELADLRNQSRMPLPSGTAMLRAAGPQNALAPVPVDPHRSEAGDANWKEPIVLDSSVARKNTASGRLSDDRTATSIDWQVSPMSHSAPATSPRLRLPAASPGFPVTPPGTEQVPAILPPLPGVSRSAKSDPFQSPFKTTLAPPARLTRRVPEIIERTSTTGSSPIKQIAGIVSADDCLTAREFDIQTTVIHVTASRPVDAEPAGVRMLNPALSKTASGDRWTHEAVAQELLRKVSLQAKASIAGRQKATIHSGGAAKLTIGSSCPHCNEVHGFAAGDRLLVKAGSGCDDIQKFNVTSEVAGGGRQLESIPEFKLTPAAGHTYVISEEAVEGTVEELISTSEEKLVPIHGVLTPVSGPDQTRVSTQLMQRLIVVTFRDRNVTRSTSGTIASVPRTLALPAPEVIQQVAARKLTPVDRPPVFLPPPAPASAIKAPRRDSNIENLATALPDESFPKISQANYQADEDFCEVCQQKHGDQDADETDVEQPAEPKQENRFLSWFRRVKGESTDSESAITNAEFNTELPLADTSKMGDSDRKHQRRYVTKPGNRRPVR